MNINDRHNNKNKNDFLKQNFDLNKSDLKTKSLADAKNLTDKVMKAAKRKRMALNITLGALGLSTALVVPIVIYDTTKPIVVTINTSVSSKQKINIEVKRGTKVNKIKVVQIEGYEFLGYFKDEACTQPYGDEETVSKNSLIFACYKKLQFAVSLPSSEKYSIVSSGELVEYGDDFKFSIYAKEGFDVSGVIVMVGNKIITPVNGEYIIPNIKKDTVVAIDGVSVAKHVFSLVVDGVSSNYAIEHNTSISDALQIVNSEYNEYNSIGWYADSACTIPADLSETILGATSVYTHKATLQHLQFTYYTSLKKFGVLKASDVQTIVIPAKYKNNSRDAEVVGIEANAFENCVNLQTVTLPATIQSIGDNAFANCSSLNSVVFLNGSELIEIGSQAFYKTNIKKFTLPSSVQRIDSYAFAECSNLENIYLNEGLKSIGSRAFDKCSKLKFVNIPASVETMGENPFTGCSLSQGAVVDENNETFCSIDNHIINKTTKTLVRCSTSALPLNQGIEVVGSFACYNLKGLTSVILPQTLKVVGSYAFYGTKLTQVSIPNSVAEIEDYAFAGISSLTKVLFEETSSQKSQLASIGANAFNGTSIAEFVVTENVSVIEQNAIPSTTNVTFSITLGWQILNNSVWENIEPKQSVLVESLSLYTMRRESAMLSVAFAQGVGYTISTDAVNNKFAYGDKISISLVVNEEYARSVPSIVLNGETDVVTLTSTTNNQDGSITYNYATNWLYEDVNIIVDGVKINEYNTVAPAGQNYTFVSSGETTAHGANYVLTITSKVGYEDVTSILVNGKTIMVNSQGKFVVESVVADLNIEIAEPVLKTYTISAVGGTGYVVNITNTQVQHGSSAQFYIGLKTGYDKSDVVVKINGLTINGVEDQWIENGIAKAYKYTIAEVTDNVEVTISNVKINTYNFSISSHAGYTVAYRVNGAVVSNISSVKHEDFIALEIITQGEYSQYRYSTITVNGVFVSRHESSSTEQAPYYEGMFIIDALTDIVVEIEEPTLNKYSVTSYSTGEGYQLDCPQVDIVHGTSYEFWLYVNAGYSENDPLVTVNGTKVTGVYNELASTVQRKCYKYTVNNVTSNLIINASVGELNVYDVIMPQVFGYEIQGGNSAIHGTDYSFTVEANIENYRVQDLLFKINGVDTALSPSGVENGVVTYTLSGITQDTTITIENDMLKKLTITWDENLSAFAVGCPTMYGETSAGDFVIPAQFTDGIHTGEVQVISGGAFLAYNWFDLISIPSTVTTIEYNAFSNVGDAVIQFAANSKLTTIGDYAFSNNNFENFVIPTSVTSIGDYVFNVCQNLKSINLQEINITELGNGFFEYCTSLESITIPASVTTIANKAFASCTSLQTINFEQGSELTEIGDYAFANCGKLTSINLEECTKLTQIGMGAFSDDEARASASLSSITIPASVAEIGHQVFEGCSNLETVIFEKGIQLSKIQYATFRNSGIKNIEIPASVETIEDMVFHNCARLQTVTFETGSKLKIIDAAFAYSSIKEIVLPEGLTVSGLVSFSNCEQLTSIILPSTIHTIQDSFDGCTNLTTINIPANVNYIYGSAFDDCTSLTNVEFENVIGWQVLENGSWEDVAVADLLSALKSGNTMQNVAETLTISTQSGNLTYTINPNKTAQENFAYTNEFYYQTTGILYADAEYTQVVDPTQVLNSATTYYAKQASTQGLTYAWDSSTSSYTLTAIEGVEDVVIPLMHTDGTNSGYVTYVCHADGWGCIVKDPAIVKSITIPNSITGIFVQAFNNCVNLETIIFEENSNIEEIYDNAFANSAITTVTIPKSISVLYDAAFANCSKLTEVLYEEGIQLTEIKATFMGCSALRSIFIPKTVKKLTNCTFDGCTSLQTVTFEENSVLTRIEDWVFRNTTSLESINLPDSLTYIGKEAFTSSAISSINIPNNVTYLGESAFKDSGIMSINIPSKLENINERVFSGCSNLITVSFAEDALLKLVGNYAFENCTLLQSIELPDSVTTIGTRALSGTHLTDVIIPASVTTIGTSAFEFCWNLETVTFEEGCQLTTIGASAFASCSGIGRFTIPASVISIGVNVFADNHGGIVKETLTFEQPIGWHTEDDRVVYPEDLYDTIMEGYAIVNVAIDINVVMDDDSNQTYKVDPSLDIGTSLNYSNFYYTTQGLLYSDSSRMEIVDLDSEIITVNGTILYAFKATVTALEYEWDSTLNGFKIRYSTEGITTIPNVVVPLKYNDGTKDGYIVAVDELGFSPTTNIRSVALPNSLKVIGNSAFLGCTNLQGITLERGNQLQTIGDAAFEDSGILGIVIRLVSTSAIPENVTTIGYGAFANCGNLQSITISASVQELGEEAFNGCSNLQWVTFAEDSQLTSISAMAFQLCSSLTSLTIPASVTEIGTKAFHGCGATSITFAEGSKLTTLGTGVFALSGITSISIPAGVTAIPNDAFFDTHSLQSVTFNGTNLVSIGNNAFYGCNKLQSIEIPASVTTIGDNAFYLTQSLQTFTFAQGSKLTTLGDYVFSGSSLSNIIIPLHVKYIGGYVFDVMFGINITFANLEGWQAYNQGEWIDIEPNQQALHEAVNIYASMRNISADFDNDGTIDVDTAVEGKTLAEIMADTDFYYTTTGQLYSDEDCTIAVDMNSVPTEEVTYYSKQATVDLLTFNYTNSGFAVFVKDKDYSGNIVIPAKYNDGTNDAFVEIVGFESFSASAITSVVIPASVTVIRQDAFSYCDNLTSVTFEDGSNLTEIEGFAFNYCEQLQEFVIPENVTSIGSGNFFGCKALQSITIPANVETIGGSTFSYCTNLKTVKFAKGSKLTTISANLFAYSGIESVTIPAGVIVIEGEAFEGCSNLTEVVFENGSQLQRILVRAFCNCTALSSITLPTTLTMIGANVFSGCADNIEISFFGGDEWTISGVPASKTEIVNKIKAGQAVDIKYMGVDVFVNIGGTDEVVTMNSDETILSYMYNDNYLPYVTTGQLYSDAGCTVAVNMSSKPQNGDKFYAKQATLDSLSFTWDAKLQGFTAVQNGDTSRVIVIPEKYNDGTNNGYVKKIGKDAFAISPINSVTIPSSVVEIGDNAFNDCINLTTVKFESGSQLKKIGNMAFLNCSMTSMVIPDSVTSIGEYAFKDCSLVSVQLPAGLTEITYGVFKNCQNLAEVEIPAKVIRICSMAFANSGLYRVTFAEGSKLTEIWDEAFMGCYIYEIEIPTTVTHIGENAFNAANSVQFAGNGYWEMATYNEDGTIKGYVYVGKSEMFIEYLSQGYVLNIRYVG